MSSPGPSDAARSTRVVLRPIASPFPLGFSGLATASLLVAGLELHWYSGGGGNRMMVALVLIGFSFPLQFLASVFGFLGRDTSAATSFGVQSATWLVVGLDLLLSRPGSTSHPLAVLLFASSGVVLLCALGSAMGKLVPAAVLFLVCLRYLVTGLYEASGSPGLEDAAAIVGLVLTASCAYAVLALELENLQRRTVLPLLRRGSGREAMSADLPEQSQRLAHEAGVREQL